MTDKTTADAGVQKCGHCGFPISHGENGIRHFGTYVTHSDYRCRQLFRMEIDALLARAETAEARVRELEAENDAILTRRTGAPGSVDQGGI